MGRGGPSRTIPSLPAACGGREARLSLVGNREARLSLVGGREARLRLGPCTGLALPTPACGGRGWGGRPGCPRDSPRISGTAVFQGLPCSRDCGVAGTAVLQGLPCCRDCRVAGLNQAAVCWLPTRLPPQSARHRNTATPPHNLLATETRLLPRKPCPGACVRACMRACVRACVRTCVRAWLVARVRARAGGCVGV